MDVDNESLQSYEESASEPESDDSEEGLKNANPTDAPGRLPIKQEALQAYYESVVSIVDKLFDLSILIRGVSRKFRVNRAAAHVEIIAGQAVLEEFKELVALKIRWLYPEIPEWLAERLTKVIVMRRQQFYYQRAHRRKMSGLRSAIPDAGQTRKPENTEKATYVIETKSFKKNTTTDPITKAPQVSEAPRTMKSGTTKKTYDTIATDPIPEIEQVNSSNVTKITPSERLGENAFPNPPKEPKGKAFECNQCFYLLHAEMRRPAMWTLVIPFLYELTRYT